MICKSVETRDWLNTIEPRNIRSVMKRVIEEVTVIDKQVETLYKDGPGIRSVHCFIVLDHARLVMDLEMNCHRLSEGIKH